MVNTRLLRARYIEFGYIQDSLAKKIGITQTTFNAKINNKRDFTATEIKRLCDCLAIDDCFKYFFYEK